MIYGIGVDIVKIDRMKAAAERWGTRFLSRVFTENEIAHCFRKKEPYPSLSVRFAAKEALIKAIGSGLGGSLQDIEVTNSPGGRPLIAVKGRFRSFFDTNSIQCAHLTLSHEREYGIACVVIEN
jgi:holo-[acyl-carrier protein] synthase